MFGWLKRKSPRPNGPDLSWIDSQEKAEALFLKGELEKLYLMPLELGGDDNPLNVLYVTLGLAGIKSEFDNNVIIPLAQEGKITKYKAVPEYQGSSVVPISIKVTASDPGEVTMTFNIWGGALAREKSV
jgi:hypothetical protein